MNVESKQGTTASPCKRNCCLNSNDVCVGCWRTLDEILQWSKVTESEKIEILKATEQRKRSQQ